MTDFNDAYDFLPEGSPEIWDAPGDGWHGLVHEMCKALSELPEGAPKVAQIKQKFGGLRVYLSQEATPAQAEIIAKAIEKAKATCEICGKPGTLKKEGWMAVYCEFHMDPKHRGMS